MDCERSNSPQTMNLLGRWLENVGFGSDRALHRHDDLFTDLKLMKKIDEEVDYD